MSRAKSVMKEALESGSPTRAGINLSRALEIALGRPSMSLAAVEWRRYGTLEGWWWADLELAQPEFEKVVAAMLDLFGVVVLFQPRRPGVMTLVCFAAEREN